MNLINIGTVNISVGGLAIIIAIIIGLANIVFEWKENQISSISNNEAYAAKHLEIE